MAHVITSPWLLKQTPYSSIYTSDFDQKYPLNQSSIPYLPPAPGKSHQALECNKQYYYASTYRADYSRQLTLPRTFNNQKHTRNWASV